MADVEYAYIARAKCGCAVAGTSEGWEGTEAFVKDMEAHGMFVELVPISEAHRLLAIPCTCPTT